MKQALKVCMSVMIAMTAMVNCGGLSLHSSSGRRSDSASPERPAQSFNQASKTDSHTGVRTIQFSGYDWWVKSSDGRVGPGPNYFSDSNDNVTLDSEGRLHLRVTQRDGRWYCAEVVSTRSFGYGTYRFYLDMMVDDLDPQVILGMFTWNDAPAYNHREIDIEVSRWGQADNQNAQFVVQPYTRLQNILRFQLPSGRQAFTHLFTWKPESVFCQSLKGSAASQPEPANIIQQHTFTKGIPQAGGENARINLWLLAGHTPKDGQEVEIIISKFEFIALS